MSDFENSRRALIGILQKPTAQAWDEWNEGKHPRDPHGKFGTGSTESGAGSGQSGNMEKEAANQRQKESAALGVHGKFSGVTVIKYPSGRFGFAGKVPRELSYQRKDGKPMTEQDFTNIKIAGPMNVYKSFSYATEADAKAALESLAK